MFQRYVYAVIALVLFTLAQANAQDVIVRELPDSSPRGDAAPEPSSPEAPPVETVTESEANNEQQPPYSSESLTEAADAEEPQEAPLKTIAQLSPVNLRNTATFRGLNKITAKTFDMTTPLEETIAFGTLDVKLHLCWQSPPQLPPENKALLTIWENVPGEKPKQLFFGWMFSSNPAISALNHPVYDLTLLSCEDAKAKQNVPINEGR